jgi:hypothetical protein
MLKAKTAVVVGLVAFASISLSACGTTGANQQAQVNHGTVRLDAIRVGTPEDVFKEAIMTFVPDALGSQYGKNQYISRLPDANGGQYVVQAKDDVCFEVSVVHAKQLAPKQLALETMHRLLPSNIKDEPVVKTVAAKDGVIENYTFGKDYTGQVVYADKGASEARVISVTRIPSAVATASQTE